MDIVIGFSKAKAWWKIGSKVIAATEKRQFSHAYIRYKCSVTGIDMVAQASHGMVNEISFERFKTFNVVLEEYSFNIANDQDVLTYIKRSLGKDYSKLQLLLITIKKLFKIELDVHNNDTSYICSEFVAKICEIAGILPKLEGQDYITPSDLNKLIKEKSIG